jgi:hypothetical protein
LRWRRGDIDLGSRLVDLGGQLLKFGGFRRGEGLAVKRRRRGGQRHDLLLVLPERRGSLILRGRPAQCVVSCG